MTKVLLFGICLNRSRLHIDGLHLSLFNRLPMVMVMRILLLLNRGLLNPLLCFLGFFQSPKLRMVERVGHQLVALRPSNAHHFFELGLLLLELCVFFELQFAPVLRANYLELTAANWVIF